jgi:flavin-dependent dehydrogenase
MRFDTDVFIVGGGPAGLAVAIAARSKGLHAIVADGASPPIAKTCGEGLLPDAVAALRKLGIVLGAADGHILRGISFENGDAAVAAEFRGAVGLGMRREVLHQRMVDRAEECGVSFAWNTPITRLDDDGVVAGGNKVRARWVIGADGARSRVRRWAGLEKSACYTARFAFRQHYRAQPWSNFAEVHWDGATQAYATPVGPEEICVAIISNRPEIRGRQALRRFPKLQARLADAPLTSSERGAITRTSALQRVAQEQVALVGDASGSLDAISAAGLSLGLRQALALAEALKSGDLRQYQLAHQRLSRRPQFMAKLLVFLAQQAGLRRRTFQAMQAAPNIFDCMLAYHLGETRPLELAASGAQFSWRFLTA